MFEADAEFRTLWELLENPAEQSSATFSRATPSTCERAFSFPTSPSCATTSSWTILTVIRGHHTCKFGAYELLRGNHTESHTFFPGRFVFGTPSSESD